MRYVNDVTPFLRPPGFGNGDKGPARVTVDGLPSPPRISTKFGDLLQVLKRGTQDEFHLSAPPP